VARSTLPFDGSYDMKLTISFILLALALPIAAQDRGETKLEDSLYYRALVVTLDARARDEKLLNSIDPLQLDPLNLIVIQKDRELNAGFPARIGDVAIEYLWPDELRTRYQRLKHKFPIFVMRPISNDGDRLVVAFTRYWFTATKKSNDFGLEGGYRVVLRYDCSQKTFIVESAKLWGI
jgi:hypothetical protein